MKNVLVTGGCGFIGSNFVKYLISLKYYFPIILDKLTYAGSKENINQISEERFELVEGDICDEQLLFNLFKKYKFDGVFHLAAESHVDNSILNPINSWKDKDQYDKDARKLTDLFKNNFNIFTFWIFSINIILIM